MRTPNETGTGYLANLDGLRFIAVMSVMVTHWAHSYPIHRYTEILAIHGVNLFFVLSGFLITKILLENKGISPKPFFTLRQFYIRRVLRIFPVYYLVLLVAFIVNIPFCRQTIGWLLTYTANISMVISSTDFGWMSHFWTLSVEEQFYIFFPLMVIIAPRKYLLNLFLILALLAILSRIMLFAFIQNKTGAGLALNVFTPCCFDCFVIGSVLAYLFIYNQSLLKRILKKHFLFWICFVLSFIFYYVSAFSALDSNFLSGIIFVRFFFTVFCFWLIGKASLGEMKKPFSSFLNNGIVAYLGKISYGLYIFHNFIPFIFRKLLFPGIEILFFITTVALASLSWEFFEHPINKLKKYFPYKA